MDDIARFNRLPVGVLLKLKARFTCVKENMWTDYNGGGSAYKHTTFFIYISQPLTFLCRLLYVLFPKLDTIKSDGSSPKSSARILRR